MKNKYSIAIALCVFFIGQITAQDCSGDRYRLQIFDEVEEQLNVQYGSNLGHDGTTQENLLLDIYFPKGDTDTDRPLIIFAHGGSFVAGDKSDIANECREFAKMGFVVASIKYRILNDMNDPELATDLGMVLKKEVIRSVHDMRAAIRFFRKSVAEENNPYGINPKIIIVGGASAGAILANHVTYLDEESEVPQELTAYLESQGGLEGFSGNEGYSSVPQMMLSWCGAIMDTSWIKPGDQPFLGLHNLGDAVVPNLEGEPDFGYMTAPVLLQGDSLIFKRTLNVGVNSRYIGYPGDGHCDFPEGWIDVVADFVHEQLCEYGLSITENKDAVAFSIFPNPAEAFFNINIPNNQWEWSVSVTNMLGQTIAVENIESHQNTIRISSSMLDSGIYLINLISENGQRAVKRVVVN